MAAARSNDRSAVQEHLTQRQALPTLSAQTKTACGRRSDRPTSQSTGSPRPWNSATCRSLSTSGRGSPRPRCRQASRTARARTRSCIYAWNRRDDALATLLEAERVAPEQIRYHYLSRQLVHALIRRERAAPITVSLVWRAALAWSERCLSRHGHRVSCVPTSVSPPMSAPRIAAGALFHDESGRILLVKPTYKNGWDIPGGYVEPGETPSEACAREVFEELSLEWPTGSPLVADWAPMAGEGDKVLLVSTGVGCRR